MSGFTSEDFAGASFARHPGTGATACRVAGAKGGPAWTTEDLAETTDEDMARDGWVPVVESRVTEHTLRDSQEKAARKRQRLVDHIADQDRVIRRRNDEIAALRERVRVAESGRLSLDRLAAAWEAAEVLPDSGLSAGDLCIERCADDHYEVFRSNSDMAAWFGDLRILSRAPKPREPWQDLADVIGEHTYEPDPKWLAQALYRGGVRVTGGDDE